MEHDGCCSRLYTGLSTVVGDIILGTAARGEGRSGMLRIAHRSRARHGGNPLTSPRLRRAAWDCRRLENPSSSHHCESAFARPAASPRIAAARMPLLSRHQKAAPTLHTARRVPTICMPLTPSTPPSPYPECRQGPAPQDVVYSRRQTHIPGDWECRRPSLLTPKSLRARSGARKPPSSSGCSSGYRSPQCGRCALIAEIKSWG